MAHRAALGLRAALAVVVMAAAGGLVGACRDVVTDDVVDASSVLCGTLEACSLGRACDRVDAFFDGEAPEDVDGYLAHYDANRCADGCGTAPACLDHPGICLEPGEDGCGADVECCGGSSGEARCDGAAGCCLGLAVPCEEGQACCSIDGNEVLCADSGEVDREGALVSTCGGLPPCRRLGESCSAGADCCSGTCDEGVCARITCVDSGAPCQPGDECCETTHDCRDGTCQAPDECADPSSRPDLCCAEEGGACQPEGTQGPDLPCCGDGARCVEFPGGGTQCSSQGCGPPGATCGEDADCCQPAAPRNAGCLAVVLQGQELSICQDLRCEPNPGDPCDDDFGCCAGLDCVADRCVQLCDPGTCHLPAQVGPPIDASLCGDGDPTVACAAAVCAVDPSCCCFGWDSFCVQLAVADPQCAPL